MEQTQQPVLKLNLKRTFLIGFAFFGILLLWQVYDSWCPPLLTELFKNSFGVTDEKQVQYLVGIMMAIDNLAALILLPIFGRLSDKTHTKIGKRMPYILVGTFPIHANILPLQQCRGIYCHDVNRGHLHDDVS